MLRKEVPIQIEIARRTAAAAMADRGRAEESVRLTRDDVEKGIDEARAGVKAAQASLTLAELEYGRFTRLAQQEASTTQRQQQVDPGKRLRKRRSTSPRPDWPGPLLPEPRLTSRAERSRPPKSPSKKRQRALIYQRLATIRSTSSSCWSRSRNNRSSMRGTGLTPPSTTWHIPRSRRRSLGSSLNATGTWATSHRLRLPF